MNNLIAGFILIAGVVGCSSAPKVGAVVPPAMPRRVIARPATAPAGDQVEIEKGYTVFVPKVWGDSRHPSCVLTIHFHTEPWFAIEEHLRRGLREPLLVVMLGQGSTVYRVPFEDRGRLGRLVGQVEKQLNTRVKAVDVSSFSAGYGAVREIVKWPEYRQMIRRIVLCDSMYGSFAAGSTTRPAAEHIEPWMEFAKMAARGEKTFVLTHSQVPTASYASSGQCAAALVEAVGGAKVIVPRGSMPATLDPEFPLLTRSDVGHFHVWAYDGANAQAHLTHVRHLADVWKALDAAGEP
jgi:hypothetical protein